MRLSLIRPRVGVNILLFIGIFIFPFWFNVLIIFLGLLRFPYFWESLLYAGVIALLYDSQYPSFFGDISPYVLLLVFLIFQFIHKTVRERMLQFSRT